MTAPRTWALLAAVETRLQSITQAAGYHTDVGTKTTREPAQIPDSAGMALAVALESVSRPEDPAVQRVGHRVQFIVAAKVGTGLTDAQQRLHELIADITTCMADRSWLATLPAGTQFPTFVEASVIPPVEGVKWIGAAVRFSCHITNR